MSLKGCIGLKRKSKNLKSTNKLKFQKKAVIAVLIQVFLYTWVHLILSFIVGVEIAPTVSCAFYAFCGAEAGLLAWIKKFDKKESEEQEHEREDFTEIDKS